MSVFRLTCTGSTCIGIFTSENGGICGGMSSDLGHACTGFDIGRESVAGTSPSADAYVNRSGVFGGVNSTSGGLTA
jgi:hypothetical protein